MRKIRIIGLLLGGLLLFSGSPAGAYVVLVLHPEGYVYSPGGDAPAITAQAGETFTLLLSVATDATISVAGINAILSFDPSKVEAAQESAPVDEGDGDPAFAWTDSIETNEADNTQGSLSYEKAVGLEDSLTLSPGQYALGSIEWNSHSSGQHVIAVDEESDLLAADEVENLFTDYRSCTVNPGGDVDGTSDGNVDTGGDTDSDGSNSSAEGNGGAVVTSCFIATAAYGSDNEKEVVALRKFRDRYLLKTAWGKELVSAYYHLSPPLAEKIRQKENFKRLVRISLKPLVRLSRLLTE